MDLKDAAAACADLAEVVRLDPTGKEGYWRRAEAYCAMQPPRLDDAVHDCDRLLELDGEDSLAHRLRGVGLLHRGDKDAGVAELTRAIDLDPDDVHAYVSRARVRLEQHRDDEAIADATAAVERESEEATAYVIRGMAYADKHEDDTASADLAKAAAIDGRIRGRQGRARERRPNAAHIHDPPIRLIHRVARVGAVGRLPPEPPPLPERAVARLGRPVVLGVVFLVGARGRLSEGPAPRMTAGRDENSTK